MRGSVNLANLGLLEFRLVWGLGAGQTRVAPWARRPKAVIPDSVVASKLAIALAVVSRGRGSLLPDRWHLGRQRHLYF